jgi:hydroxymethylpyrimidine/phosphomethylpyrimidine kinase
MRAIDAASVGEQARCVLGDIAADAFKLGVLGSAENVRVIAGIVSDHPEVPLVLDPVLASGRGDELAGAAVIEALCEAIVPRATVVTPNSIEARRLGGPQRLLELGCDFVLVTGTHEAGPEVVNTLYDASGVVREDRWQRLPGEYHGSGCTLASAIAAALASGRAPADAVREAQAYTWQTLAAGFRPGSGQSIPRRLLRH